MSWPTNTARRVDMARLLLAHVEHEFLLPFRLRQQRIAGLLRERLEVLYRARVGRHDAQYLAADHLVERLARAKDRQGTVHPPGVELFVVSHDGHGRLRSRIILAMSNIMGFLSRAARAHPRDG